MLMILWVTHPANLRTICKSLNSTDLGLSFCRCQYRCIFIHFYTASSVKAVE